MVLAIIDHINHQLFIESVSHDEIVEKYHDEEEEYIRDKYGFKDEDIFSWEWLTEQVEVFGEEKNGKVKIHRNL